MTDGSYSMGRRKLLKTGAAALGATALSGCLFPSTYDGAVASADREVSPYETAGVQEVVTLAADIDTQFDSLYFPHDDGEIRVHTESATNNERAGFTVAQEDGGSWRWPVIGREGVGEGEYLFSGDEWDAYEDLPEIRVEDVMTVNDRKGRGHVELLLEDGMDYRLG